MGGHGDATGRGTPGGGSGAPGDVEARRRQLAALVGTGGAGSATTSRGPGPGRSDSAAGADHGGLRARLGRVCGLALPRVGVAGAGVTVMAGVADAVAGHRDQVWSTGPVTRRLEALQLTAGQGPCLEAFTAGAPVLVPDLAAVAGRWWGFGPGAVAAGAAAVFSLPVQIGAVRLGTLDLHRDTVGSLTRDQLADALILASLATEVLLELADPGRTSPDPDPGRAGAGGGSGVGDGDGAGWLPGVHAEVHQASGMVSARERIGVGAALLRIRGHAFAHDEPIDQVARRIIARDLVLDDP